MKDLAVFDGFGIRSGNEVFATRKQIQDFYEVPLTTLVDSISKLKEDGLINPSKIRHVASDGRNRLQEVFSLQEVIKIGFRLRSEKALSLQDYAAKLIEGRMSELIKEKHMLELELSYAWNKSDAHDLYNRID